MEMIWEFESKLIRRLMLWAGLSVLVGLGMLLFGDAFWRGFGIQAAAWGAVDGLIAWFGQRRIKKHLSDGQEGQAGVDEARRIRKILWINTALDLLYIAGGLAIAFTLGGDSAFWRGTGWGIIVQAAFLFIFDLWHAGHVPNAQM